MITRFKRLFACGLALGVSLLATGVTAAQFHVDYKKVFSYGSFTIGAKQPEIWHIDPGGNFIVISYIELGALNEKHDISELWLEGGEVNAGELVLRYSFSAYRQYSGTLNLSSVDRGFLFDAGAVEISGGVANAPVTFRNCTSGSFKLLGGMLNAAYMTGDNMKNVDFTFAATDAYVVAGHVDAATAYAITMTEPVAGAPKSLTITGTPVSGCTYGLVNGIMNDTFYTAITPTVPTGWSLVRRGDKLLLVETATLSVATATWTGAANDGNPRTPGNWTCRDASGETLEGALPGVDTLAYVPSATANFTFAATNSIALGELHFTDDTYALVVDADWSGLTAGLVTRYPKTIDVNGHKLRLTGELPEQATKLDDLTEPGGRITVDVAAYAGSAANLIDDVATEQSRLLIGSGNKSGSTACNVYYDYGEGRGKVVRGVRFHPRQGSFTGQRRPKDLAIYGTMVDPASATADDWTLLKSYSNLNLREADWSDYLTFDNETPYRAYRINFTKNMSSDANGNFLELWEMEFASAPPLPVSTVTSGVAGGELHFDVPEGNLVSITRMPLAGSLKVVKDGAGTLGFAKKDQTFTGGIEVFGGAIQPDDDPKYHIFGGSPTKDASATTITLHGDTLLDLRNRAGWAYTTLVLDGGMVGGRSDQLNPCLSLSATSSLRVDPVGSIFLKNMSGNLNGQTLRAEVAVSRYLVLDSAIITNGVLDIVSGGWLSCRSTPHDLRTVDLKINAALELLTDLTVHDYDAKWNAADNVGTAAFNVFGTFTPRTDYFYGCTLQDGAAIDLSSKTGEWCTTSKSNNRATVGFADGASVTIQLGARRPAIGDRLVYWIDAPSNLATLRFAAAFDDPGFVSELVYVTDTGVFYGCDPNAVDRAYWTGGGDPTNFADPANWACTNAANAGVDGGVPSAESTVCLGGLCALNVPTNLELVCKQVVCTAPVVLTADCDWRGLPLDRMGDNFRIDLDGHRLAVWIEPTTVLRGLSVADTSTGDPGELHVAMLGGAESAYNCSTLTLDGNLRFVKEGVGMLNLNKGHQTYTGGTVIAEGSLRSDVGPSAWAFGCDGDTAPDAQKIYVRPDGVLYLAGKTGWNTTKVYLEGGKIDGQTQEFNPQTAVSADSRIGVRYGDVKLFAADGLDLDGHTIEAKIEQSRNLVLNLSSLSNGVLDVLSGGWFVNTVALDARTVDLKMGAALSIAANMSVRDYEAKYNANNNVGTAALSVYGTFTPTTDYFYGCTMQDGSTIDLSGKSGAWDVQGKFTNGKKLVTFANGATVVIDLGTRKVKTGECVVSWASRPANLDTLKFKLKGGGQLCWLVKRDNGLYLMRSMMIIMR